MKNLYFTFMLSLVLGSTCAQDWDGDVKWVYKMVRSFPIYTESLVSSIKIKDTIINGVHCVEINNGGYLQNENKIIKLYDEESDEFKQIYDFNLGIGDTLYSYCYGLGTYTYGVIDSIKEIEINGEKRIMQYLTPSYDNDCMLESVLIESIGGLGFLLPEWSWSDSYPTRLLCYEDNTFSYPNGTNCNDITIGTDDENQLKINLYPNPSDGLLQIIGAKPDGVRIYSKTGKLVRNLEDTQNELDISDLEDNMYILILEYGNQQVTKKIIKTSN